MPVPLEGTNVQAFATGGNVQNQAILAGSAGTLLWLTKVIAVVGGSTAASSQSITITGLQGGNITIPVESVAGAGAAASYIILDFLPPLKASNPNVDIVATLSALGAGNITAGIAACGIRTPAP